MANRNDMTSKRGDETDGCIFQWKIENISHCWVQFREKIDSPWFIADSLEGTKWTLRLFPSGRLDQNYIGLYLRREEDSVGPPIINVNSQLTILNKDGSILEEENNLNRSYRKRDSFGYDAFEELKKVLVAQKGAFLLEDTLTVQCTMWNTEEKPIKPQQLFALTVFEVHRNNFLWRIENVSALRRGFKNKIRDRLIKFDLGINEGLLSEKKLFINMNSFDERLEYFSFKVSAVDFEGKKENFVFCDFFAGDLKKGILFSTSTFTEKLFEDKSRYLPNDVLSLDCEYVYSNGSVSNEQCGCGTISPKLTNKVVEMSNTQVIEKQEAQNRSLLVHDLKSMYEDAIFSDMQIRTLKQTFPAHKAVLSARSPVFRSMFSHDMKEKISGHVDVTDFEDDTVRRMLLYIYTDTLDDLQLESACKLYEAADKYEMVCLKSICSSFLKDNLCPAKACEVLSLAERHQEDDLKCVAQSYILEHYKEVFGSREWRDFMATNIHLAADMMYRFTQLKIQEA